MAKKIGPRSGERKAAWLLSLPAIVLLMSFVVLPVVLGLVLGFTNAQLLSPNRPEFTGLNNFRTLLGVATTTLHAEKNADGSFVKDSSGEIQYESVRPLTREGSKYPSLVGKTEMKRFGENKEKGARFIRPKTKTLLEVRVDGGEVQSVIQGQEQGGDHGIANQVPKYHLHVSKLGGTNQAGH